MKMFFSLVIVSLLSSPGQSLMCYVCSPSSTNDECNNNKHGCQAPLDTCMTVVDTLGAMKAIVKQCASQATCMGAASTASVDAYGNGNSIGCCNYNLCNYSGAESIHVHTTLMLVTVVSVFLLLSH